MHHTLLWNPMYNVSRVVPPYLGGGLWPVGGWVSLVLGNLAERAYPPPPSQGERVGSGWVGGWVGSVG